MPDQAVAALAGHRGRQEAERALAGPLWQEDGFVFSTALGRPLSDKVVSGWFTRLLKRAQVGHGRLYDCRHTAASLLLAQGVHARVIMELLGHSTFRLTMDTYTHVLPPSLQEAARAMNAALGKVEALSQSDSRAAR